MTDEERQARFAETASLALLNLWVRASIHSIWGLRVRSNLRKAELAVGFFRPFQCVASTIDQPGLPVWVGVRVHLSMPPAIALGALPGAASGCVPDPAELRSFLRPVPVGGIGPCALAGSYRRKIIAALPGSCNPGCKLRRSTTSSGRFEFLQLLGITGEAADCARTNGAIAFLHDRSPRTRPR